MAARSERIITEAISADRARYNTPLMNDPDNNVAMAAARALVFEGVQQPNGYTEPLLHRFRAKRKAIGATTQPELTAA